MISNIIVVDDDPIILKMAWNVLTNDGMKVVVLKGGRQLFNYIEKNPAPDLILLDIAMPDMDGFEVLQKLRRRNGPERDTPVMFLTASEDEAAEMRGLALRAMDYIKKPFHATILTLRVKHAVELVRLQKDLASEVEKKTRENEQLFLHVVASLADAIDAKDAYTNGHSGRVAYYSREIARRYGYDSKKMDDIYIMGLLHDVGKIGVSDVVINKDSRLSQEEESRMKKHPSIGGRILENIKEMPELSLGAKYHHENFDGSGYPEGLKGRAIPETARIIAVADAYDAMSSNRSYRKTLPQDVVRKEIEKGKGTQFDPVFADIMISMIDEDKDYCMQEGGNIDFGPSRAWSNGVK